MSKSPPKPGPGRSPAPSDPDPSTYATRDAEAERTPPVGRRDRQDELLADQSRRWSRGDYRPVEAYLADHPDLTGDVELMLALVNGEILHREERGESVRLDEYLDRFPALAD